MQRKQNISTIVKWFAKKYVISIINDVIAAAKSKVDIETWKRFKLWSSLQEKVIISELSL